MSGFRRHIMGVISNSQPYISGLTDTPNSTISFKMRVDYGSLVTYTANTDGEGYFHYDFSKGTKVTSFANAFNGNENLLNCDISHLDFSLCTNFASSFQNCKNLISVNGNRCDLSSAVTLGFMFAYCNYLEKIYGIERWNPRNVTSMNSTFNACFSLKYDDNEPLDLSGWNLPYISDMTYAFGSTANNRNAWRNATGKAAFSELNTLKLPAIKNGVTTTNTFASCEGLMNLNIQSLASSLSFSNSPLSLQSAINVLNALQDVTSYGGATLTFSSITKGYINNDQDALALVANAVNNLGWTIALT